MSYNPFLQMIAENVEPQAILAMLKKGSPKLSKKIGQLMIGGYSTSEILKFLKDDGSLAKAKKPKNPITPYEIAQFDIFNNKMEVPKSADEEAKEQIKKSLPYVATGFSMALPFAAPELAGIANIAEQITPKTPREELIEPLGQLQGKQTELISSGFPKPDNLMDYIFQNINIDQLPIDKREKLRFLKAAATKLQKEGKTFDSPEAQALKERIQKVMGKKGGVIEEETERFKGAYPDTEITQEEATQMLEQPTESESKQEQIQEQQTLEEQIEQPEETKEEKPKSLGKGSKVITKDGDIAEIEDLPGKTAKINVDGKKKIVNSNDIIDLPISEKRLAQLYDEMNDEIKQQTGQEVSRHVNIVGYDASRNALSYKPHNGPTYIWDALPTYAQKLLFGSKGLRKTTGKNFIGLWVEGTDSPIGAMMSKLLQELKKNDVIHDFKFEDIYDSMSPVYADKKLKEKEEREAVKEQKRLEREKQKKAKKTRKPRYP